MALFLSTFTNKLDKKGRISVPAPFRLVLGKQDFQGVIGFRSYTHPTIEGMGVDRMQRLSESVDQLDVFSEDQDDLASAIFADAQMMSFDTEGRIIIPPHLLEHAHIKDMVAFVGRGATFQMWNPELFEDHQKNARTRIHDKRATLKMGGSHA